MRPAESNRPRSHRGILAGAILIAALGAAAAGLILVSYLQTSRSQPAAAAATLLPLLAVGVLAAALGVLPVALARRSVAAEVDRAYHRLRVAAEVGRAASSVLDLDELLRQVVNLVRDRFDFYHAAIFLLDEAGETAVLREATGEAGAALKARRQALRIGSQSLIGWVTAQRRPRVARDRGADPLFVKNELLPGARSELAVPLVAGDRLLGALHVQARAPNAFGETEVGVLQALADQVALVIANAALHAGQRVRAEQRGALLEAALELARPQPELGSLLDRIASRSMRVVNADSAAVWLPAEDETFELVAAFAGGRALPAGRRVARNAEGEAMVLAGSALAFGRAVRFEHGVEAPAGLFASDGDFAGLLAPLNWQGQAAGMLALSRSRPGAPFGDDDQNAIQLLAFQAAAAIANHHLLAGMQVELTRRQQSERESSQRNEELAALTRREQMINEITGKIRRSTDVAGILETTATELGKALGAARARIEIGPDEAAARDGANGRSRPANHGQEGRA